MWNSDPGAIAPPPSDGGIRLAALTTPRCLIAGGGSTVWPTLNPAHRTTSVVSSARLTRVIIGESMKTLSCALAAMLGISQAQTRSVALDPLNGLKAMNVKAESVTYRGRKAVRITDVAANVPDGARLALVSGTDFEDGVIEVELTGDSLPGAPDTARGFTGIAFRVIPDGSQYECLYLRPKNGRSEDQLQRNHSAQYISFPEFPWQRLRSETPGKYESYVDLEPGAWTKVKIEVRDTKARLYVNAAVQPTLIVNDLKRGKSKGAIALWIGPGVVAHFAKLKIGS